MGSLELQIFVSLFVILGAAFVALLCDFLKGNNERLRERNIELQTRHEERDKREKLLEQAQRHAWNVAVQAQEQAAAQMAAPPPEAAPAQPASEPEPQPRIELAGGVAVPVEWKNPPPPQDDAGSRANPLCIEANPIQTQGPDCEKPRVGAGPFEVRGMGEAGPQYPEAVQSAQPFRSELVFLPSSPHSPASGLGPVALPSSSGIVPLSDQGEVPNAGEPLLPFRAVAGTYSLPSYLPAWLPSIVRERFIRELPFADGLPVQVTPARPAERPRFWTLVARWPLGKRLIPCLGWPGTTSMRTAENRPDSVLPAPQTTGQRMAELPAAPSFPVHGDPIIPEHAHRPGSLFGSADSATLGLSPFAPRISSAACPIAIFPVTTMAPRKPASRLLVDIAMVPDAPGVNPPAVAGLQQVVQPAAIQASGTLQPLRVLFHAQAPRIPAFEGAATSNLTFGALVSKWPLPMNVERLAGDAPSLPVFPEVQAERKMPALGTESQTARPGSLSDGPLAALESPQPKPPASALAALAPQWAGSRVEQAQVTHQLRVRGWSLHAGTVSPLALPAALAGRAAGAAQLPVAPLPWPGEERTLPRLFAASPVSWSGAAPEVAMPVEAPLTGQRARFELKVDHPGQPTFAETALPRLSGVGIASPVFMETGQAATAPEPSRPVTRSFHPFASILATPVSEAAPELPVHSQPLDSQEAAPSVPAALESAGSVVRIRVLRDEDLRPLGSLSPLAADPVFFGTNERRMEFQEATPELEDSSLEVQDAVVVEGGFAYDPVSLQKAGKPPSRVLVMPSFDDVRTLFYPAAPKLERSFEARQNLHEMPTTGRGELLPPGLQPADVLTKASRRAEPFHGTVMVIGINDYEKTVQQHGEATIYPILDDVLAFVTEKAGGAAFLCRHTEQEIVLAWPLERLENAQRVVHSITECLWDYQLRTLGGVTVIFGWGSHESEGSTLAGSLNAARDQMVDNRKNRRATMTGVGRFRRQLVG